MGVASEKPSYSREKSLDSMYLENCIIDSH